MIDNVEQPSRLQRSVQLVVETGLRLAEGNDLKALMQTAADAGLEICGAQIGAFFYSAGDAAREICLPYALSGSDASKFAGFPRLANTTILGPTFAGSAIVCSADITKDPRCGLGPFFSNSAGYPAVRSYLAVPVKMRSGEVLGGLFYGHEDAGVFDPESADLVAAVAAQAGGAIEVCYLREQLDRQAEELKKADLRQRDAARQASEMVAIVESSDDAILSKDLTGKITSWNRAASRILGYSREEMVGKSILTIIPPELHAEERTILEKIHAGERIDHYETVRVTKSGERIDVSLSISPVRDAWGAIVGASKILRDITQKKNMEKSLLQAEKIAAVGRMAATIAHEINNPLEAIMNLIFLARTQAGDKQAVTELLSAAESELVRISHIARQTLGFYRETASASPASLSDLAADAIRIYEPRCTSANIRIEKSLKSGRKITLRKGEILQVISNLVANAMNAMPEGGVLSISTRDVDGPAGAGVELAVEDNGVGIPEEHMPRIFEAFFTTRRSVGTGIGLFVAKQFVEGHNGSIQVRSSIEPESHGTRMSVFLPEEGAKE